MREISEVAGQPRWEEGSRVAGEAILYRLFDVGYGVRLDTYTFEEREMHVAIERLLADTALRERMASEGEEIRRRDGKTRAADLIERLGFEHRAGYA